MSRTIALIIALLLGLTSARSAWAHGGGPGLDYDPCAMRVGLDYVHMSAYQPQLDWFQEYCGTIPAGGNTLFVFDLIGSEMRHVPVSVNLVELTGHSGGVILFSIPSAEHVSGVINFSVALQPGHSYMAVVTVGKGPMNHTLAFPISVNTWWSRFEGPALLILAVLWACIYYCLRLRREHLAMPRKTAMGSRIRAVGSL